MNPLIKRFPRELKNNIGKYLGIFAMMVIAIGLTSGFLSAASSISVIIDDMYEQYSIEDARFTTNFKATDEQLNAAVTAAEETAGTSLNVYELFTVDGTLHSDDAAEGAETNEDATLRAYKHRTEVDIAAYAEGTAPTAANEIALDRVFASHRNLGVGSTVDIQGQEFTVTGIMTMPDYMALFEDNSAFTLNTMTFGVAEVSDEGFAALTDAGGTEAYTYALRFDNRDLSDADRVDAESDFTEVLTDEGASLTDFIDKDANQGIGYPADDIEGDSSMWETLMMLLIAIMAFMFVVLVSSTVEEESAMIGTLMASGWRKRELVLHYSMLPCLVGIIAAAVGNVVGYVAMAEPMQNLYYNSYSLPPYVATWDWHVFFVTTVAPVVLLVGITVLGLALKMRRTPLQFLRHELSRRGAKHGFALPERMPFMSRFRIRVFLQNFGNFVTLFLGICFASMLLLFGLAIMPTMNHYADNLSGDVPANHMYTLKAPLELEGTEDEVAGWKAIDLLQDVESSKLDSLEDAADGLEDDANALEAEGKQLQAYATKLQSQGESLASTATALQNKGSELQNLVATLQTKAAQLQTDMAQLESVGAELQSAAADAQAKQQALEADPENQQLQAEAAEAAAKVESLQTQATQLQSTVESLGAEVQQMQESAQSMQASLESQAADATSQQNALQSKASKAESWQKSIEDRASALEDRQDELYAQLDAIAADLGITRDELTDAIEDAGNIDTDDENIHPVNTLENSTDAVNAAEKYAVTSLDYTRPNNAGTESITVYGVQEDSAYWKGLNFETAGVSIGGGVAEKFDLEPGDTITLYDKYEEKSYTLDIGAIYGSKSNMSVYMSLAAFNDLFGNDEAYFNGYASSVELNLNSRYVASDLTPEDMTSIADQMTDSMGDMLDMLMAVAVMIFFVFMYLLTKVVIDRSARAISYMKVFGYNDREINRLYLRSITVTVAVSLVACIPVILGSLTLIFMGMLMRFSGNIEIFVPTTAMVQTVVMGFITYLVVAFIHTRRIKKVPLSLALKVQE